MTKYAIGFIALYALLATPAWASSGGNGATAGSATRLDRLAAPADNDYIAGQAAIKQQSWREAISRLELVVKRDANHANAWNLLGFAHRNLGEMEKSFTAYERALAINPQHKDAHEYIGEAYIQVGNLAKAEEHLRALENICGASCEQTMELKEKIEEYKRKASGGVGGGHRWMRNA